MSAITGTYRNGRVVLDAPADWPEGCRVVVEPVPEKKSLGILEEDWPKTPEEIARYLALMEQVEPLEMTPAEEAEWQAARQAQKDHDIARFEERSQRVEDLFR